MPRQSLLFLIALLCLMAAPLAAQQTSKSKSKDRFREKPAVATLRVSQTEGINTAGDDRNPAFYQQGLVFHPDRPGQFFAFALFDPMGQPTAPGRFDVTVPPLVAPMAVTFSRDGASAYFTARVSNPSAADPRPARNKIFLVAKSPAGWADWQELAFNGPDFSCQHPTLSADGRTLYFASDRPGGYGGLDLWKVERSPAGPFWGPPVNLGPAVNTAGDEDLPFLSASGMLFFASNGRPNGLGGFDLYQVETAENVEPVVLSLGAPFNSAGDDFGLILKEDGSGGFFVSDRPGGQGGDDIYSFSTTQ